VNFVSLLSRNNTALQVSPSYTSTILAGVLYPFNENSGISFVVFFNMVILLSGQQQQHNLLNELNILI
jgi:hypothetical protein